MIQCSNCYTSLNSNSGLERCPICQAPLPSRKSGNGPGGTENWWMGGSQPVAPTNPTDAPTAPQPNTNPQIEMPAVALSTPTKSAPIAGPTSPPANTSTSATLDQHWKDAIAEQKTAPPASLAPSRSESMVSPTTSEPDAGPWAVLS